MLFRTPMVALVLKLLIVLKIGTQYVSSCTVQYKGCAGTSMDTLPSAFTTNFLPACSKLDICYSCGNTKKWLREECDKRFLHDMHRICRTTYRKWYEKTTRANCKAYAKTYYKLVSVTGRKYYDKVSPKWCTKDCVVSKGSPDIKYQENL
ncbi:conodipine-P3-like [Hydractinia symbiolongicarpus]|uniref:conodipine-P3-like n=1 Tax=Hydractinia symbiolongicarpus TaxID=13093 RepID=UPI00254D6DC6|nr:conodipine-P3-like [Hydractinia symbiolongicarpus]